MSHSKPDIDDEDIIENDINDVTDNDDVTQDNDERDHLSSSEHGENSDEFSGSVRTNLRRVPTYTCQV